MLLHWCVPPDLRERGCNKSFILDLRIIIVNIKFPVQVFGSEQAFLRKSIPKDAISLDMDHRNLETVFALEVCLKSVTEQADTSW